MSKALILECRDLAKTYRDGHLVVPVFKNLHLRVDAGEMVAIIGPSGAGKSTLLQMLGGLDKPTEGSVFLLDQDLQKLSELKKSALRNRHLGFIYQFHHLLPEFSVFENVCMPLMIAGMEKNTMEEKAKAILEKVGLSHRMAHRIQELSGGERQRVAIARALVHQPSCILADEPTGNLDHHTGDTIFALFKQLCQEYHSSVVMVTHNQDLAKRCDRVLTLQDGALHA